MSDDSNGKRLRAVLERGGPSYADAAVISLASPVLAEFFEWFKDRGMDVCEVKSGMHRNVLGLFSVVYPCPICSARKILGDIPEVEAADA